ncbi:hypothetical protein FC83_GL002016 [Agrilactobacillus composti DSM 18527 = JCM 14202]|uniref:Integral membrane protein n=1 Tax=Agrilactobacillus composti DSM 18527 = JCM 14202 TaxID=1423734 RepID=X0QJF6_9LACO|nr:TMEM175 family protein [Agrilactobacillus composti]KRM34878.1 hypothetical protein FC83_GL002016 [Agrilactobacillus composti DSM 18527 = JCM 14202]GAF38750.1 predicted integral membrane protein [Agrilactobacillus composti DSM 18527 = JCM 14202]
MEKLKTRLDAFSDAIIAIIITIMVLDIPPVLRDSWPNYLKLSKSIGIFFISFIFVANMWYQHGTAFEEIDTMTYRILILDIFFLAVLSLIPLFTNMMAANTTRITVMLYGILQALVNIIFRALAKAIIHLQYTDKGAMQKVYVKIYGSVSNYMNPISLLAIVVAFFFPEVALFLYLAYPIIMFLMNSEARQQMYDVAQLPEAQQQDFTTFNADDQRAFRKAQRQIRKNAYKVAEQAAASSLKKPTTPKTPPQPAPKSDFSGRMLPEDLSKWLDQNVNPAQQRRMTERYSRSSEAQRQQLAQWVKERQKQQQGRPKRPKKPTPPPKDPDQRA